jgi:hypothetical protein
MDMQMNYCRMIFATFVRSQGVDSEIVNLLQGRIGKMCLCVIITDLTSTLYLQKFGTLKSLEKLVVES